MADTVTRCRKVAVTRKYFKIKRSLFGLKCLNAFCVVIV